MSNEDFLNWTNLEYAFSLPEVPYALPNIIDGGEGNELVKCVYYGESHWNRIEF